MAKPGDEIAVGDAPAGDSPAMASTRAVDVAVSLLLLAFAGVLAFDVIMPKGPLEALFGH